MKENVTRVGMEQNPDIDWENYFSTTEGGWDLEGGVTLPPQMDSGGYVPMPARKSIYRDPVRATKYLK